LELGTVFTAQHLVFVCPFLIQKSQSVFIPHYDYPPYSDSRCIHILPLKKGRPSFYFFSSCLCLAVPAVISQMLRSRDDCDDVRADFV
jgi:hypothetical protein